MASDGSLAEFFDTYDFPEEVRVEFIDGEIVVQANPLVLHDLVTRVLVRSVPEPFEAWPERGLYLSPDDKPKPDAVIIRSGDWSEDKHAKYAAAGIPVYLILDPNIGEWIVYGLDGDGKYDELGRGPFGRPIPMPEPMGFEIDSTSFHRYPAGA